MAIEREETWWFQEKWTKFRTGSSEITVHWGQSMAGGVLYDVGVPRTVEAVSRILPLTIPIVHVAWSGDMVMGTSVHDLDISMAENEVRLVRPGDITYDHKVGELGLVYGDAECRLPSGPNTVTVIGTVNTNFEALAAYCHARRFDGVGEILIKAGSK